MEDFHLTLETPTSRLQHEAAGAPRSGQSCRDSTSKQIY